MTLSPVGTSNSFQLVGSHTYTTAGKFTPTVTITDLAGPRTATVFDTATVTNSSTLPPLQAQPVAINGVINQALTNVPIATFTDPTAPDQRPVRHDQLGRRQAVTERDLQPGRHANTFQLLGTHDPRRFTPVVTITDRPTSGPDGLDTAHTASLRPRPSRRRPARRSSARTLATVTPLGAPHRLPGDGRLGRRHGPRRATTESPTDSVVATHTLPRAALQRVGHDQEPRRLADRLPAHEHRESA